MLVAPRDITLQTLCEAICDKWRGAGVVMPTGHTIPPGKPFATAGDILLDLPVLPVRPEKLISGSPNSEAVWTLVPPPEAAPLWQLSGDLQGTCIRGGTFRLPQDAFILLSECSGIRFEAVNFVGGAIVAMSSGCSASFDRCHFTGCTLVATGGAEVATSDCVHEAAGIALFCSGRDTKVVARGGTMRNCEQCACAADSAMLEMHGVACSGACITAVEARGDSSYLVMHGCSIKSSRHVPVRMRRSDTDADSAPLVATPLPPQPSGSPRPAEARTPDSDDRLPPERERELPPSPHRNDGRDPACAASADASGAGPDGCGAGGTRRKHWAVCGVWGHSGARVELTRCVVRKMAWGLWLDGATTHAEIGGFQACGMRRGSILVLNGAVLTHAPPEREA